MAGGDDFRIEAQRGADLAARMDHAMRAAFEGGARPVLLRGSDSPLLDRDAIDEALLALREVDVVASPDEDGGYHLIGANEFVPGLFDHPMSTATVLADTFARAERAGRRTRSLRVGFDLDTVEDLHRFARELKRSPATDSGICHRTRAFLERVDIAAQARRA